MREKEKRHLEAKAYDYDFVNDSIFFYKEGEKYRSSLEFNGIILDFSEDDYLMNLEMLDVSEKFNVSKSDLLNLKQFNATINIDKNNIKITMTMEVLKRNQIFAKSMEALTINNMNIPSGTQEIGVIC